MTIDIPSFTSAQALCREFRKRVEDNRPFYLYFRLVDILPAMKAVVLRHTG
ncbi:hypothetical protein [Candidatus Regiella insecticola]|uniref:hypothetical protein n=1 Tax=Candidatus Regiella insecticola TaxID=138073 RepID=UPI0002F1870E|nr:hypothetical protein [Candidatus Regiella insecticola]